MAQLDTDGMRRHPESPKSPNRPSVELLYGEVKRWSPPTTPKLVRESHEDQEEEDQHHHHKKSVLSKVREKAKKWTHTIVKKKHNHDNQVTPAWGVSLDDYQEEEDEDPEYLGAPMYESELAPEGYKEAARQHPRDAAPMESEKHVLVSSVKTHCEEKDEEEKNHNKTIADTLTEKLVPAYTTVSEATQMIASKIQGLAVSATSASATQEQLHNGEQKWDKGVSVKEYLLHKLEPGVEERALSQVISEAISPRKDPGDPGRMEKFKEAVTSLLWTEESSSSSSSSSSTAMNKSRNNPISQRPNYSTSPNSDIPISTNACEVDQEETEGRMLQTN